MQPSKFDLIRSVGEECLTESELRNLLEKKPNFVLYDGFEPSGRMHIAQGVFKAMNVNKCTQAGGTFIFWVADWFALMNDKMGGDLEKIKTVGKYLIEVWKAAGMNMSNVKFLWSSDEIVQHAEPYWTQALDIARVFTILRVKKCCQIMGRTEAKLTAAQILYPIMQCTDVFFLKADICQLGVDQRKVNMLAREYCDHAGRKLKPVVLSHHMLYGLKEGQAKMSKSDPDSAIFMEDAEEDVFRKLNAAYCPREPADAQAARDAMQQEDSLKLVEDLLLNPCLDYLQYIVFCIPGSTFEVAGKIYTSFVSVKESFIAGEIDETDLKRSLALTINKLIQPVRDHFQHDPEAKQLIDTIKSYGKEKIQITTHLRRMSVTESKKVHVVFAPLAKEKFTLGDVFTLIKQIKTAEEGSEVLLWLRDWSSFCLNKLGGDKKAISAVYTLLVETLKTIIPHLMAKVRVILQSQAILSNPSDYWISVINVGRKFPLERVLKVDETNLQVSHVITSLMHVGDVLSTSATMISCPHGEEKLHMLAIEYYGEVDTGLSVPSLHVVDPIVSQLRVTPPEGGEDEDIDLYVTDVVADVGRKIKRAFCEAQNVTYCPPLVLLKEIVFHDSDENGSCRVVISRRAEDGGDKIYSSFVELEQDFLSGSLHPGDLKPAVTSCVNVLVGKIVAGNSVEPGKTSLATVKNYIKRSQAAKKKKKTKKKKKKKKKKSTLR
eukprot:TRINITY_DN3028_c0_g1_i3.p1 TRINITY_DN3028_c0_g1~~TRINITY_DN3028_c0_g1_i3.p1  ORF type:complete len:718 (+),score=157.01 TRINITY_DN3028_c0_g1_i3:76-2229(+)